MQLLSRGNRPKVTHIIHIADIHIRLGDKTLSRSLEYTTVFNSFLTEITALPCIDTSIIMIAGDIFHSKCKLESEGTIIIFDFINKLLEVAPVLLCMGNHDMRQENPSFADNVEALVKPYETSQTKHPIHYLKDTGTYVWENLLIGTVSVKDTLRPMNTAGVLHELPPFPRPSPDHECNVAFFHGTISQSALPNGRCADTLMTGYPLQWFEGYDIVVLGDNHMQQVVPTNTITYGYSGSLIQQDFGEPLFGHGYIIWDIATKTGIPYHVRNDYGAFTVVEEDGALVAKLSARLSMPLESAVHLPDFPTHPKIRVLDDNPSLLLSLDKTLASHGITPSLLKTSKIPKTIMDKPSEKYALVHLNSIGHWHEYMKKHAPELDCGDWLNDPSRLLFRLDDTDLLTDKMKARNKKIEEKIAAYDLEKQHILKQKQAVTLKHMRWSYLMAYGADNHVDFDAFEGGVALLNGRNASGKSCFLDVICIALYGDATPHRGASAKIIHDAKPEDAPATVYLRFELGGSTYEIHRIFGKKKNVQRILKDPAELVAEGSTMVARWVTTHIGSMSDLLMSSLLCQVDDTSFFHQSSSDQKAILDKALNLNTISLYQGILEEAKKAYDTLASDLSSYLKGRTSSRVTYDTDILKVEACELEKALEDLSTEAKSLYPHTAYHAKYQHLVANMDPCDGGYEGDIDFAVLDQYDSLLKELEDCNCDGDCDLDEKPQPPQFTRAYCEKVLRNYNDWLTHQTFQDADEALARKAQLVHDDKVDEAELQDVQAKLASIAFVRPRTELTKWEEKLKAWKEGVPRQSLEVLKEKAESLSKSLESAKKLKLLQEELASLVDMPHNPECWACIANNPKSRIQEEVTKFKKENRVSVEKLTSELGTAREKIASRERHDALAPHMKEEQLAWKEAAKQWKKYDDLNAKVVALKQRAMDVKARQDEISKINSFVVEWEGWESSLAQVAMEQLALNRWDAWRSKEVRAQLKDIEGKVAMIEGRRVRAHFRLKDVNAQIKLCQDRLVEIRSQLKLAEQARLLEEEDERSMKVLLAWRETADKLGEMLAVFVGSKKSLGGFKAGLYRDYVIPAIESMVNDFICEMDDVIKLRVSLVNDKMAYHVEDQGNLVPLGNASGYQRCLLGIAARVVLTRIAAMGHLRHLFLDEAFVAFDATNMARVSELLEHVVQFGGYTSVVLMSHQSTVRDVATFHVNIERNDKSSKIMYGLLRGS